MAVLANRAASCSGGRRLSSPLHPIAEEAETCAICLTSLCSEAELDCRLAVLSCNHGFHHECIAHWVHRPEAVRDPNLATCPLCKQGASAADLEQLLDNLGGRAHPHALSPAADRQAEYWLADWTVPLEDCCPSPRIPLPPPEAQSQAANARSVITTVFGGMQPFWSVHEGWRQMQGALDALRHTLTSHGWTTPEPLPPVGSPPPPDDSPPPKAVIRDLEDVDIFQLDLEE